MRAPVNMFLVLLGVLWLIPTLGLFLTSILPAQAFTVKGWWQIFSKPSLATWDNYRQVLHNHSIMHSLVITAEIAVANTLIVIVVGALAGYAFAWLEFPGRDWIFIGVIALLVVPLQMALIPMFSFYNKVGLYDTVRSIVLFHAAFGLPFAIFLLRNFFVGIPKDIMESARIDGASELKIFVRLILPLGLPAIASLAIFQFLWTWNDLIVALTFGQNVQPITVAIFSNLRQFGANIDLIAPASFISLIVPAGGVLRLPALLRPGAARRLGEVSADSECAIVGGGLAGFVAYATLVHGGIGEEITVFDATGADPARPGGGVRRRSASGACARRATATASRPRSRVSRFVTRLAQRQRHGRSSQSVCDRYHPTVDEFLEHVEAAARAGPAGTRRSSEAAWSGSAPSTAASTLDGPARSVTCFSRRPPRL